jgi:hypothetical protein
LIQSLILFQGGGGNLGNTLRQPCGVTCLVAETAAKLMFGLLVATSASSSDPYAIGSSGLKVVNVVFNATCLAHGCWQIDIAYY